MLDELGAQEGSAPPEVRPFSTAIFHCGGTGARPGKDGLDVTAFPSGVRTIPIEATEAVTPVLFRRREFREGSGGAGQFRGGLGQIIELGGADGTPIAMLCNFERIANPARGRDGGGKGAPGRVTLVSGKPIGPKGRQGVPGGDLIPARITGRRRIWQPGRPRSRAGGARCRRRADFARDRPRRLSRRPQPRRRPRPPADCGAQGELAVVTGHLTASIPSRRPAGTHICRGYRPAPVWRMGGQDPSAAIHERATLIAALPIDDVAQWQAVEIGARVFSKSDVDRAVAILVAGARDMRRHQHPRIGPQPRRRRMLEFADIDVEHDAAQTIALQRVGERVFVDDLTARDIDQHASRPSSG